MISVRTALFILLTVTVQVAAGQPSPIKDSVTVTRLLDEGKSLIGTDSTKAVNLTLQARDMAMEIGYLRGEALAHKNLGMVYYMKGQYAETLDEWNKSLEVFENMKDDIGISNILNNIGSVYLNQGADAKALEYCLKSLQIAEKVGDTLRMISALSNVGGIYYNKKDPVALNYLLKAIPLLRGTGNTEAFIVITGNIGEIYSDQNDDKKALEYFQQSIKAAGTDLSSAFSVNGIGKLYQKEGKFTEALEYHNRALTIANKFDDQLQVVRSLRGIADVYLKQNNIPLAIDYYTRAKVIAEKIDDLQIELKDLYQDMATAYSRRNDFTNAFRYQTLYASIKDSLYNIENKKKLNQLQFDFELSKKQVEINLKEAKIKTERQARMAMTGGLALILIIAFIIYRNYRQKVKVNKLLDRQKDQIEHLLLNILPKEVAQELQTSGESAPRQFEEASILFTDFKGFTAIADKLSPGELVADLNECFIAFDTIIEKYNLEKIKTIGDAYMCAGNLPSPDPDHAYKIVKAAMEIQNFMESHNAKRAGNGLQPWEIRIGLNVGPVVAGVVGKKKYAYDIWGSAVNIASRMESNGTPGRVNVSAYTYEKIKDRFQCSYRGKIYAKNLGDLDMYYIDYELTDGEMPRLVSTNQDDSVRTVAVSS